MTSACAARTCGPSTGSDRCSSTTSRPSSSSRTCISASSRSRRGPSSGSDPSLAIELTGAPRRRSARARTRTRARPRDRRGLPAAHPRGLTPIRVRQGPGATLPAVPKNLVIVESPAKARTIERYLGADYRVLASYGHVRDLPENPGKGKFGVDVDHDFEPEYVISTDRRKQVADIEKAAKSADAIYLATDLDREGEAIAWHVAEATHMADDEDPPGDVQRDHRIGDPRGVRPSAPDRPAPRRCAAGPADRGSARRLHAEPAPLAQGPRRSVGRARPVRGGPARRRARTRDQRLHAARVLDHRGAPRRPPPASGSRPRSSGSTARPSTSGTRSRPSATPRPSATLHPQVTKVGTRTQKRSPAPPFTTSTLQQEASRRLGYSPKRTMSIAQRLYEGVETSRGPGRPDHLHADGLDGDRRRGHGRGPRGDRRPLRRDLHDAQGPGLQDQDPRARRRPTSRSGRRASGAIPTRSRVRSSPTSCGCTG